MPVFVNIFPVFDSIQGVQTLDTLAFFASVADKGYDGNNQNGHKKVQELQKFAVIVFDRLQQRECGEFVSQLDKTGIVCQPLDGIDCKIDVVCRT